MFVSRASAVLPDTRVHARWAFTLHLKTVGIFESSPYKFK
jgi:hypothetical protein